MKNFLIMLPLVFFVYRLFGQRSTKVYSQRSTRRRLHLQKENPKSYQELVQRLKIKQAKHVEEAKEEEVIGDELHGDVKEE